MITTQVNLTKHQSLVKSEAVSQRWSTIGAVVSSVGAWLAFASMTFHQSGIESRVSEIKQKRELLIQQRNEAKLRENLRDFVNTVQEDENWFKDNIQPTLIPLFTGLTLFMGCYLMGRRQAFRKHLSELVKEREKAFPSAPIQPSTNPRYKPLSSIKIK